MITDYMKQRQGLKLGTKVNDIAPHKPIPKRAKPLNKRSQKMKIDMKLYKPLVKQFLAKPENQECKIKSPVCKHQATCVNHKRRRGSNLLVVAHWEPACGPCNGYCESHDAWARENGHLESAHKKD